MSLMSRIIIAVLLALSPYAFATAQPSSVAGRVELFVRVQNCSNQSPVQLSWMLHRGAQENSISVVAARVENGARVFYFVAPVPHFWARVQVGRCNAFVPITALDRHARHVIALPRYPYISTSDSSHWLAGILPAGVTGAQLLDGSGHVLRAAMIDDGCFYFELLGNRPYTLEYIISPGAYFTTAVQLPSKGSDSGQIMHISDSEMFRKSKSHLCLEQKPSTHYLTVQPCEPES